MKAVLLCGGEGVRLRPLTCDTPKPMLRVLGRPLLEYTLRHLKVHGVEHAALTLGYLAEEVVKITQIPDLDMKLDLFTEEKPLGTAGAVARAAREMKEAFFVVSGDAMTDMDLSQAMAFHKSRGALCTCILHREADPSSFGVAVTDRQGKILGFQEKPNLQDAQSYDANTGIYVLEPEVLTRIPKDRPFDFAKDLFPSLVREGKLFGIRMNGYWSDIGSVSSYLQVQQDLMQDRIHFAFQEGRVEERTVHATARIDPSAKIDAPVYIAKNCVIGKGCVLSQGTVLEEGCIIGDRCGVKGCLLGRGTVLERNVQLRRVITAQNVRCREDSRAFEGVVLGSEATLGRMASVSSCIRIWPQKSIRSRKHVGQDEVFSSSGRETLMYAGKVHGTYGRDLSVSVLTRMASAYGKCLGVGSQVAIAASNSDLDQSIQQILCGALREQGIHVLDAGDVTQGMLADAVASMKLQGGIGIRTQQRDLTLYFLDEHGFAADSSFSRKFEDAMDRMAEEVCTLAVGTCLQIHGIRSRYLKKCGRWLAFPESYCIGLETQEPIPDDELLGGLGLRLGSQDEKKVLTLVVDADGFCVRDEQEKEYSREMTRCLLLQAYAESGSMKGYWPIPADCWDEEMKKACLKRGIEIERSSIRQDLWIRALIRQGHSAQVCDAAVFFDPWLAAALLVSVLRKAGKTLSQWSRIPDNSVWIREYPEELAPELTRRLAELRAEAAEMLDSAMILEDQGEVYLEWGGEDSRIRLYAGPGQQEKLELMSRGLLE